MSPHLPLMLYLLEGLTLTFTNISLTTKDMLDKFTTKSTREEKSPFLPLEYKNYVSLGDNLFFVFQDLQYREILYLQSESLNNGKLDIYFFGSPFIWTFRESSLSDRG